MTTQTLDLARVRLAYGGHDRRSDGVCLLEAVAWFAGEPHSDHPKCTCPVLGALGRELNDRLGDSDRQRLVELIPDLVGTAGDGHQLARGYLAADWVVRTAAPAWLDLAGVTGQAELLRALAPITDDDSAWAARTVARGAYDLAWKARIEAFDKLRGVLPAATAAYVAYVANAAAATAAATANAAAANAAATAAAKSHSHAEVRAAAVAALEPTRLVVVDSAIDLYRRMIMVGRS